ncbi:MAG: group II intron reverse transcriptase domain-containing protein [Candidatus Omnitrophica bacterium]|nr:group II intron reverse transcriptase domain-containing protein [Candidatus Omnitrophota bacterium]
MAARTTTTRPTPTTTYVVSGDEIPQGPDIDQTDLTFEELATAYFDCRKNKRNSIHARIFEFDLEKNLFDLYEELLSGNYRIGRTVAFVVETPKIREIWASTFRDRVVHHVIYNRLAPRFYPSFIRNSFACIPGRGTLDGSNRLWAGMRSITHNWKEQAYFLQGDVRNFFVSINKDILLGLLTPRIHEQWLLDLTRHVLFHDPRNNCLCKSTKEAFARVPRHKSLWNTPLSCGLPIGNLTSQFFANVYLDTLDQFVKHTLRAKYYYRYVDDFVILDISPGRLNDYFSRISEFCAQKLMLELHPFKKRIAPVEKGIDFIGFVHKPYYRWLRGQTAAKMVSLVHQWEKSPSCYDHKSLVKLRSSLNSYMGLAKWASTHRLRKYVGDRVDSLFIYPDKKYSKLIVGKV